MSNINVKSLQSLLCDMRTMVTFPAEEHHHCLAGTNLYRDTVVNDLPKITTGAVAEVKNDKHK